MSSKVGIEMYVRDPEVWGEVQKVETRPLVLHLQVRSSGEWKERYYNVPNLYALETWGVNEDVVPRMGTVQLGHQSSLAEARQVYESYIEKDQPDLVKEVDNARNVIDAAKTAMLGVVNAALQRQTDVSEEQREQISKEVSDISSKDSFYKKVVDARGELVDQGLWEIIYRENFEDTLKVYLGEYEECLRAPYVFDGTPLNRHASRERITIESCLANIATLMEKANQYGGATLSDETKDRVTTVLSAKSHDFQPHWIDELHTQNHTFHQTQNDRG